MVTKRNTREPVIFSAPERRFIENVVAGDKPAEAGLRARITADEGRRLYKNKRIRFEIDRQLAAVSSARVELTAKSRALQQSMIDEELEKAIKADVAKNGMVKIRAMELGYERIGLRRDGEFIGPVQGGGAGVGADAPAVYRAMERQTTRVTTEQVTERAVEVKRPMPKAPQQDAKNEHVWQY